MILHLLYVDGKQVDCDERFHKMAMRAQEYSYEGHEVRIEDIDDGAVEEEDPGTC